MKPIAEKAAAARQAAETAAARAGVRVELLREQPQGTALVRLLATIWGVPDDHAPIDPSIVAAMIHGHGYVSAAYAGPVMVAGSIGFVTGDAFDTLHSHITGVVGDHLRSGVGTAVKLHQRAWAVRHGLSTMTWTFDPLIARNARFNLHRLGAQLTDYLVDFYGPMNDGRNRGQPSDRVYTRWDLAASLPSEQSRSSLEDTTGTLLLDSAQDAPTISGSALSEALAGGTDRVDLVIPADIEALRAGHPDRALEWRLALRATLRPLLESGWQVAGVVPDARSTDRRHGHASARYRLLRPTDLDQD